MRDFDYLSRKKNLAKCQAEQLNQIIKDIAKDVFDDSTVDAIANASIEWQKLIECDIANCDIEALSERQKDAIVSAAINLINAVYEHIKSCAG